MSNNIHVEKWTWAINYTKSIHCILYIQVIPGEKKEKNQLYHKIFCNNIHTIFSPTFNITTTNLVEGK